MATEQDYQNWADWEDYQASLKQTSTSPPQDPGFMAGFSEGGVVEGLTNSVVNTVKGIAHVPGAIYQSLNNVGDFISGTNADTGQPVDRMHALQDGMETLQRLPISMIPGGDALNDRFLEAMGYQDPKSGYEYGKQVREGVNSLPMAAALYKAPAMVGKVNDYRKGTNAARTVVNEIRDITENPSFMTQAVTDDALATNIAQGVAKNSEATRLAASAQYENFKGLPGEVDITPIIKPMNQKIQNMSGLDVPPALQGASSKLNSMVPEKPAPIPSSLVDEFGNPYPPKEVPYDPRVTVNPNELQNIYRDLGRAADDSSDWGGIVLNDTKKALKQQAEAQLPPDTFAAWVGAQNAWENYSTAFKEGPGKIAQDILNKPDKRLDALYNKLVQDQKSANQLMSVMGEADKVKAQSLVLQKMLEKNPKQWESFLEINRGALNEVFGQETLNELSAWATGSASGSSFVQQLPRRAVGSSWAASPYAAAGYALGGPKIGAAIQAAGTVLGVLKGQSIMGARNLLKQAASGNPEAIATLNGGNLTSQLTEIIGTTGAGLSAYLGGPEQDTPTPLPKDWSQIKGNQQSLNLFSGILQMIGLIPPNASAEDLPDAAAKAAVLQASQIAPMAFQPNAEGYQSVANGQFYDPMEKMAHMESAMDLPPQERAKVMGGLFDRGKYVPLGASPMQTPINTGEQTMDIDMVMNSLNGAFEATNSYSDASSMTNEMKLNQIIHAQDF